MIQTDVLQKTKHPKYLDSWYFSSDSLPSCWQFRWVYKAGAEVGTIDYGRLWLYWYHNGAPGFWGWVCWATPCSTYGCVWKYSIPPNSYFDRENDDNPVDLVVHYFQTNPYFGPCFVAKKNSCENGQQLPLLSCSLYALDEVFYQLGCFERPLLSLFDLGILVSSSASVGSESG